jgi:sterol desaturase/sphingolipid hydroxylase (fatty acid hydroxylase superfamily)
MKTLFRLLVKWVVREWFLIVVLLAIFLIILIFETWVYE